MKTALRWVVYGVGGLVVLGVIAAVAIYFVSEGNFNKTYNPPAVAFTAPVGDAAAIARGEHIVKAIAGCAGCHGEDLGGTKFFDAMPLARIVAPNLTAGGRGGELSDSDIYRILRYGVKPDGTSVLVMPSWDYSEMSDADYGAVIAYIRSVPAVNNPLPAREFGPVGRVLNALGQLPINSADQIDFTKASPPAPPEGVTVEYGGYLAHIGCMGCHNPAMSGGPAPDPNSPPAANLTSAGGITNKWTEAEFISFMRTGVDPAGREINNQYMPYKDLGRQTDDELKAIWLFIQSLPPKALGEY